MEHIATLGFTDGDSGEPAHLLVRAGAGEVALAIALRTGGDLEVVMPAETCRELARVLGDATRYAKAT